MISPTEIRDKAERLYPQAIDAWLAGDDEHRYPWRIPANLKLSETRSDNIRDVHALRQSAKETIGYGYSVEWESRNSRKHGENDFFPKAITIESLTDLLKLTGNLTAFRSLEKKVSRIRDRLPELEPWLRRAWKVLAPLSIEVVDDLMTVSEHLQRYPRPGCFARELPLPVPTKLIKNHESILTAWLDILLPDEAIDCGCDPRDFERRYGFRFFERHVLTRILDPTLQAELNLFTSELSLPPREIESLCVDSVRIVIVENQVNLLTLPALARGIAFFGRGDGVTQLFDIEWLRRTPITYWGDLDVQGFEILGRLRRHYPQTVSMLMDLETIREFEHLATPGTGHTPETPSALTEKEIEGFLYLRSMNLRIEQEHILQTRVNACFTRPFRDASPALTVSCTSALNP
ncbi:MAG: Wadjet anti-phage system protein JetD domain-containing protein [Pirellula sp.]